jgi:sugar lactone lactonase YvrE
VLGGATDAACSLGVFKYLTSAGPVWVGGQNAFYFSNYPTKPAPGTTMGNIIKYTPGGTCDIAFTDVGTQGLAETPDGRLIGASYKTRTISEFDLGNGNPTPLVSTALGLPLDVPVDVMVHDNGTMYFSNRPNGMGELGRLGTGVYRVDLMGTITNMASVPVIMDGMGALALAPADVTLYSRGVATWDLDATGAPTATHTNNAIAAISLGGVAVDCAGNIFISSPNGMGEVFDSTYKAIAIFGAGTDISFGGNDGMTLLLLNGVHVGVIPTNIPGMP